MSLSLLKSSQRTLSQAGFLRASCLRQTRSASSNPKTASSPTDTQNTQKQSTPQSQPEQPKKHKTLAELDEDLRQKMAGHSGDGGDAGIEYEDGQPVSMKRSVKNNMFRFI